MTYFKRLTVIMLVVAMILGTAGIAGAAPSDVVGQPCEEAVDYLMDLGVVAGYPDGTFQPARTLTRAEVAKIVVLTQLGDQGETLAGYLKGAYSFSDVPATHWASGYIKLAQNLGVVNGYPDGTYKPESTVSHIEMVKMLAVAAGLTPGAGAWPTNWLTPGLAAGIVVEGLGVNEPITRCDMAEMTAHTIANVVNPVTGKTLAQTVFGESMVATLTVAPAASTVAIGAAVQFVATAKDADGNVLTDVTVDFATDDPAKSAINTAGLFVASASGHYTVTAMAGSVEAEAMVHVFGAATALVATPETATAPANGETVVTITVKVVDENGITVTNDDDTEITMDYDENNGAVDIDYEENVQTVENGVATFEVVATDNADVTDVLEFYIDEEDSEIDEDTVEITTVEQIATAIDLEADPAELMANEIADGQVIATVLDQTGELMLSGVYEITFSITGKGTLEGDTDSVTAVTSWDDDQIQAVVDVASEKGDPGTFTITATGEGLATASVTVSTYIAGSPVALKVEVIDGAVNADDAALEDDALEVKFSLVDKWGRATIDPDDDVDLTLAYDDDADFWSTEAYDEDEGEIYVTIPEGESSYTAKFYGTEAGTWTVSVTDDDDELNGGSFDVVVTPGEAAHVALTPALDDYELYLLVSNPKASFTAQVEDDYGNKVAQAGISLVFYAEPGENTGDYDMTDDGEVETNSGGNATVTFSFDPYVGDAWWVGVDLLDAEDVVLGSDENYAPVVITDTMPGALTITTYNYDGDAISTVKADATTIQWEEGDNHVYVIVSVDDTNGNALESVDTLIEVTFSNDGANVQEVYCPWGWEELSDPDDMVFVGHTNSDGELYFRFDGAKAGAFSITAKAVQTGGPVTGTKSFRTKTGTVIADALIFNADGTLADEVDFDDNEPVALKLSLVDNGGNVMVAPEETEVELVPAMGGEYRETASGTAVSTVTIDAGKTYKTIYFVSDVDGEGVDLSDDAIWPIED